MHCFLHIGTPKTGSTSIQVWLSQNRAVLSERGIALTDETEQPYNRKLPFYFIDHIPLHLRKRGITSAATRAKYYKNFEQHFTDEIKRLSKNHHSVVLSAEALYGGLEKPEQIAELQAFLAGSFNSVQVICYLREQASFRRSLYSTKLLNGEKRTLQDYYRDVLTDDHRFHYLEAMRKWAACFGSENLIVRIFSRSLLKGGDVRSDFAAIIDPDLDLDVSDTNRDNDNISMNLKQASVIRSMNNARHEHDRSLNDPTMRVMKSHLLRSNLFDGEGPIQGSHDVEFAKQFEESNIVLFKEFLGTDDYLFRKPSSQGETAANTFTESDLTDIFSTIMTGNRGMAYISKDQASTLHRVTMKLLQQSKVSEAAAIALLEICFRAYPSNGEVERCIFKLKSKMLHDTRQLSLPL